MQATLTAFLQRLIKRYEGGWVWDKADPGGPTNFGITWRTLADHRNAKATSEADWAERVKAMPLSEAIEIYELKYAKPLRYAELPPGVDTTMLDYGVNSGVGRAARVARRLTSCPDGTTVTPQVVAAIRSMPAQDFINAMCDERLRFMKSLKGGSMWKRYSKGWSARVMDLRTYSIALAKGRLTPQPPDLSKVPTPKAEVPKPGKTSQTTGTGLGGILTSIAGYLADLPWTWIAGAVVAIVVVSFVIGVYRDIKAKQAEAKVHV